MSKLALAIAVLVGGFYFVKWMATYFLKDFYESDNLITNPWGSHGEKDEEPKKKADAGSQGGSMSGSDTYSDYAEMDDMNLSQEELMAKKDLERERNEQKKRESKIMK